MEIKRTAARAQRVWELVFSAILLCLPLPFMMSRSLPFVYNDEFGYWAAAASFLGYDWGTVISQIPYYSYGYSLFLTPLLAVCPSTTAAYHAALALNGVWLVGSFWALRAVVRRLFDDIPGPMASLFAFAATLFSSCFTQVHFTWPETFLFFLYCVLFLLVVHAAQRPRLWMYPALAALSVYCYTVHQRTVALGIAVALFVLWQWISGRITWRHVLAFWVVLALCAGAHGVIKEFVKAAAWPQTDAAVAATNEMSGQVGKLQALLTGKGLLDFALSLCGKVFYLAGASMLLVFVTAGRCVSTLWQNIRQGAERRSLLAIDSVNLFLFLSACGTVAIAALFMLDPVGIVHLFYGRYDDHLMGVVVVLALCGLYRRPWKWPAAAAAYGLFFALTVVAVFYRQYTGAFGEASVNSAGIGPFIEAFDTHFGWLDLLVLVVFGAIVLLQTRPARLSKNRRFALICAVCVAVWAVIGGWSHWHFIHQDSWAAAARDSQTIASAIQADTSDVAGAQVLVVSTDFPDYPQLYPANGIQFLLAQCPVDVTSEQALEESGASLPQTGYVVLPASSHLTCSGQLLVQTVSYSLYKMG